MFPSIMVSGGLRLNSMSARMNFMVRHVLKIDSCMALMSVIMGMRMISEALSWLSCRM